MQFRPLARFHTLLLLTQLLNMISLLLVHFMMVLGLEQLLSLSSQSLLMEKTWLIWKTARPCATSKFSIRRITLVCWTKSNSLSTKWLISHLMLEVLSSKVQMMMLNSLIFGLSMLVFMRDGTPMTLRKIANHHSTSIASRALHPAHVVLVKLSSMELSQLTAMFLHTRALLK